MPAIELAERLIDLAPQKTGRAFLTNSESEANEAVAKLLWLMWRAEGKPTRRKFISRVNAYHGCGVMTTSLTGKNYVKAFGLPLPEVHSRRMPTLLEILQPGESEADFVARLASEIDATIQREDPNTIAGMFAEPIMGAGGVIVPPPGYFEKIQAVLRKYRIPQPPQLSAKTLMRRTAHLPANWTEQRALLGFR